MAALLLAARLHSESTLCKLLNLSYFFDELVALDGCFGWLLRRRPVLVSRLDCCCFLLVQRSGSPEVCSSVSSVSMMLLCDMIQPYFGRGVVGHPLECGRSKGHHGEST